MKNSTLKYEQMLAEGELLDLLLARVFAMIYDSAFGERRLEELTMKEQELAITEIDQTLCDAFYLIKKRRLWKKNQSSLLAWLFVDSDRLQHHVLTAVWTMKKCDLNEAKRLGQTLSDSYEDCVSNVSEIPESGSEKQECLEACVESSTRTEIQKTVGDAESGRMICTTTVSCTQNGDHQNEIIKENNGQENEQKQEEPQIRKKAKKSVRWAEEERLVDIRTFKPVSNERINVQLSKQFFETKLQDLNEQMSFAISSYWAAGNTTLILLQMAVARLKHLEAISPDKPNSSDYAENLQALSSILETAVRC